MAIPFLKNKFHLFLAKASFLYLFSYFLYEFVVKKYSSFDQLFIRKIIQQCTFILETLGFKTFASKETNDFQVFGIDGSSGVWIGGPCNGITLIFLFSIFIISYPGSIKNKLWYLPTGMLLIHCINLLRIISLSIIAFYAPQYLNFNHTYTFTFIVYSVVFALWMLWANKYSDALKTSSKSQ